MISKKLVLLLIMDGWGVGSREEANAIKKADCANIIKLGENYPYAELSSSGLDVGLPEGLMGNSEVGHLNLGAGRVVWQDITRINKAIEDKSFFKNQKLSNAIKHAKDNNTNLHLMGLVSDGGVHSLDKHYFALLEMAKLFGLDKDKVFFHAALDGRDTPPTSGLNHIKSLQDKMKEIGIGKIATISGRYYLMDRDKRWERIQKAYDALTIGDGHIEKDPVEAVKKAYDRGETDEFIKPIIIGKKSAGRIKDNDSVIFFNFRADRAREITRAIADSDFKEFKRKAALKVFYTTMTMYDEKFSLPAVFDPVRMKNILGEVIAKNNLKQLRIAETEKYAHVTYFFNGGEEKPFLGEERVLVPSPKVPTYDLQPEMSAYEVTREVIKAIEKNKYGLIVLNFANGDMVGHTGIMKAAIEAVKAVDKCVGDIVKAVKKHNGITLVTSDHGNAEEMIDPKTGSVDTYHSTNPVPFILVSDEHKNKRLRLGGKLCDVAPTILNLLDVSKPGEMDGASLV